MTTLNDDLRTLTELPWRWEWVPNVDDGVVARERWTGHLVSRIAEWSREGLPAVRAAWPVDVPTEFPVTPDMVGHELAAWLLECADQLPDWARLAWGTVSLQGESRWAPVVVIVEFRQPHALDPAYLMDTVGARGADGDVRDPVVDYVTTPNGDGVVVFALAGAEDGTAYARVNAAMRLETPPGGGGSAYSSDVLLTTQLFEMSPMGVIRSGMEQLMQRIGTDCARPADAEEQP